VNTRYCSEEWRGEQRISPPGDDFTPRGQKWLYVTVPNPNVQNAKVPNDKVPNFNMPNYNVPKCQGVDVIKCRITNVPHYNGPNRQIVEFSALQWTDLTLLGCSF
jgi:hypothetical protein